MSKVPKGDSKKVETAKKKAGTMALPGQRPEQSKSKLNQKKK